MGRPLGSAARQDGAPTARRGGAHQRHAGGSEPHPEWATNHIAAGPGPRNVHSRTRPAPPRHGPGPGRRRSEGDDPAVRLVPRRSCKP